MRALQTNTYFKDLVLLFLVTCIVYWPLTLNYLSLKNDALVQYLAYRYHLSEALRNGFFPFWSPYLYTGFPIHADIQGEVWNPLVWLLSFVGKYDMTLLQWEVLIYLYVAAVGMYRLITQLELSRTTAICCAISFMCCGYMTDSVSVIPWVASGAFVPFVLLYFLRILKSALLSDAIKLSIALSLMFLCGYPSFLIFLNYIIAAGLLVWVINNIKAGNKIFLLKVSGRIAISYLLFLLMCSPAIISYYEFLPYYSRGSGLTYAKAITNPLVPFSVITYFLPNIASKAAFAATDLSMRNTYVGLFIFLFFMIGLKHFNRFKVLILTITLFSFLFSLGDLTPVQKICYRLLPLMDTFRHPGTIRVFTSLGMIILAAYTLDSSFKHLERAAMKWSVYATGLFLMSSMAYFIVANQSRLNTIDLTWNPSGIRSLLYSLSFEQFAAFICVVQIIFVFAFVLLRQKPFSRIALASLVAMNSIVFAWIGLPFTVVSQYKAKDVNHYIKSFPDGYPFPDIDASVESAIYSDSSEISVHGYHNFYNKKITVQDHVITPTLNSDYYAFLENKHARQQLANYPFIYITNGSDEKENAVIHLAEFTPNRFSFRINSPQNGQLKLFQQYNHNWKAVVNDKPVEVKKSNIAFMSIPVPAGHSFVEWKYNPQKVYIGLILSAVSLVSVAIYLVAKRKQESS